MSIAQQIIAAAAAATITSGASAADKPLPPFVKPAPQEAVLFEASFNQPLKAFVTVLAAKVQPTERMNNELIAATYKSIRQQQKKEPGKDQQVMLFDYTISSAVIIDAAKKTIAVFPAEENLAKGAIEIKDKKPTFVFSADPAIKTETVAAEALAAINKSNEIMAARMSAMPNLRNALQPGDKTGNLAPINQKQR